jgi:hypothetical protein
MNSVSMILQTSVCKFRHCVLLFSSLFRQPVIIIMNCPIFLIEETIEASKLFFILMRRIIFISQFIDSLNCSDDDCEFKIMIMFMTLTMRFLSLYDLYVISALYVITKLTAICLTNPQLESTMPCSYSLPSSFPPHFFYFSS